MVTIKGIDPKMIANNLEPSEPTHPGELLKEEIEYRGISQKKLAKEIGISYKVLNDILNCRRPITSLTSPDGMRAAKVPPRTPASSIRSTPRSVSACRKGI